MSLTATRAEVQDPYRLELGPKVKEAVHKELVRIVKETVFACEDRDDELRGYREQLEGVSAPSDNTPWPGASTLEASITRELHLTLHAALSSACRQTPYVGYEPTEDGDNLSAAATEQYVNLEAQRFGFDEAEDAVIYLALEGRYAPMYIGDEQVVRRSFKMQETLPDVDGYGAEIGPIMPPQLVLDEKPLEDRIVYRPVDPWDWYCYPITARGPQPEHGCLLVFERMNLTREELLNGVLYNGFDEDAVGRMIELGPKTLQDFDDEADRDGLAIDATTGKNAGTWECFQLIGRVPLLDNDDDYDAVDLPDGILHADCLFMVCPAHEIVFKSAFSRFGDGERPYSLNHVIRKPNRILGEGIGSILSPIHDEMTAVERFGLNNMNLEASPMMVVTEAWLTRYSKYTVAPGRFLPRQASDPIGPKAVTWDTPSQQLVLEWLQWLDAQANRLGASQGLNSMLAGKTRKAAEVYYAEAIQSTKFDHFVHSLQYGIKESMRLTKATLLRQMKARGAIETSTMSASGETVKVSPEALEARLHDVPQASTDSMSPSTRLAKEQVIDAIVDSYWKNLPMYQQIGAAGYLYAVKFRLLMMAGERNPQHFIGMNPDTDPRAAQIAMASAMQAQQSAMMGGGQPGQPGQQGGGIDFLGAGNQGAPMLQGSQFSPRGQGQASGGGQNGSGQ